MEKYRIAILGAGVVGLSTAVCVQDLLPSAELTLIADKFNKDTLSDGAPGMFGPHNIHPDKERVMKWSKDSLEHYVEIACNFKEAGVRILSGHLLSTTGPPKFSSLTLHSWKSLGPHYSLTSEELAAYPSKFKHGLCHTTVVIDCRYYLPWLKKRFKQRGGKVKVNRINCLSEISDNFDLIINCTGLGAKELMNDPYLVPVRGQVIRVKAPWIKNFYYGDNVYICPGIDRVTLGGIKDYGSWQTNVNPYQRQYIWDECIKLIPSLEKAEVIDDWVGLRPFRTSLCLDSGIFHVNGKLVKVVNNYGHGSSGVTFSWGTAKEAANLAKEILHNKVFMAKL